MIDGIKINTAITVAVNPPVKQLTIDNKIEMIITKIKITLKIMIMLYP